MIRALDVPLAMEHVWRQAATKAGVITRQLVQAYLETNRTCSLVADKEMQSRSTKARPTLC